jgi:hypothetical protein
MPPSFEAQPTYQEYPKLKYHRTGKTASVNDRETELALGEGWGDSPYGPFGLQEGNPLRWLDEWGLESLVPAARDSIREALTDAHASIIESGADHESQVRRASMKKIFDVVAREHLDAGLLTESMLTDTIPQVVYDAAVSGRWQTGSIEKNSGCTLEFGHHWVPSDVPRILAALFESQVWRWRGKLGRQSGTPTETAEPRSLATRSNEILSRTNRADDPTPRRSPGGCETNHRLSRSTEAPVGLSSSPGPPERLDIQEPQAPKRGRKAKRRASRNAKYEEIEDALRRISEACPKSHREVFDSLERRDVPTPNAEPFKSAGWRDGFKQSPHKASAWLSQTWTRLELPAFARGPKNPRGPKN